MAKVKVEGLVKKFGSTVAVSKVSFTVNEGELGSVGAKRLR